MQAYCVVCLVLIMLILTDLIPKVGTWYSSDQVLRMQTEAILDGHLAIKSVPYGHEHDWAWGNGMQQVWGLGVPILQLPFQFAGKLVNNFGFPDRLIFLALYIFVLSFFWYALNNENPVATSHSQLSNQVLILPLLIYAFLNHGLINMIQDKFEQYEEVIAYAFLWSLLLFAFLNLFLQRRTATLYLLLCFISGFAINIRPTIGAYGGITFAIAFYFSQKSKIKFSFTGLILYLAGVGFFFGMNYVRFGSPFEFGHKLGLTLNPLLHYIVKFDNPMNWIPFWKASFGMILNMFFLNPSDYYNTGLLPLGWDTQRSMEVNTTPFYPVELLLILFSWVILLFLVIRYWRRKRRGNDEASVHIPLVVPLGIIWSLFSFVPLFYFYSKWPVYSSRYMVDFAPAIIIAIASLYFYLLARTPSLFPRLLIAGALFSLAILSLLFSQIFSIPRDPTVTTRALAERRMALSKKTDGPPLPAEYRCGEAENSYKIPYNNHGWDTSESCKVSCASIHFFKNPQCIELNILSVGNSSDSDSGEYSDKEIEVRAGIEKMQRVSEKTIGLTAKEKAITYCRDSSRRRSIFKNSDIELITIKWFDLRGSLYTDFPVYLLSLKKTK